MTDPISPYLSKLLKLLAKSNSVNIAEKMVKSWMDHETPEITESVVTETSRDPRCTCSLLKDHQFPSECQEFHWNCILQYLSMELLSVNEDSFILQQPRFLTLPLITQHNFLILLTRCHQFIPLADLKKFLVYLQDNINDIGWTGDLIRNLMCTMGLYCENIQQSGHQEINLISRMTSINGLSPTYFPLHETTVMKIVDFLKSSYGEEININTNNVRPVVQSRNNEMMMSLEPQNQFIFRNKRKRIHDEETCTEGHSSKVRRVEEMENEDSICLSSPELRLTSNGNDLTEVSEHISVNMEISGTTTEADVTIKTTLSGLVNAWRTGQPGSQSEFDTFVTAPQEILKLCLTELSNESLSENGITSIITNILQSENDISYFNLTSCFKELLVHQVIVIEKTISRTVISGLTSLLKKYNMAVVDGLLYPLLASKRFAVNHSDMISKLIKDVLTEDQRSQLFKNVVATIEFIIGDPYIWNDHIIYCLQVMVDKGIVCDTNSLHVSQSLQMNCTYHCKNLKFAKLLHTFISKHGDEFTDFLPSMMEIATTNQTAMKMRLLKALEQVK